MTPQIKTEWDLSRYYYSGLDDPKLAADIANILPSVEAFASKYEPLLGKFTEASQLAAFFDEDEALSIRLIKPSYFVFYLSSLDTQNAEVLKKE